MVQATAFHHGMHVDSADIYDARGSCPICLSQTRRRGVYTIQRDPEINMLACSSCGAASASHMPKPELLDRYYVNYYANACRHYTFIDPQRFARHLLRSMPDLMKAKSALRILDFGGGDGTLAIAIAKILHAVASPPISISIDVVDVSAPHQIQNSGLIVKGHRHLTDVDSTFDLILASAILEHIPDVHSSFRTLVSKAGKGAYMYARTPFVVPLARLLGGLEITYPAHVHDMGSAFWNRVIDTFELSAILLSSRPSLVETTMRHSPARSLVAHALKLPAMIELSLFADRTPRWKFVGGWEAVMRFD
jgi:2-polyprenyl-3-methyl-5-hydroxy-6-metoxy-1,4-benzoquinol methylase